MLKNSAVTRRELSAKTAPSAMGYNRYDRVVDSKGEVFIFIGIVDGTAHLERENKAKEPIFIEVDTFDLQAYSKI